MNFGDLNLDDIELSEHHTAQPGRDSNKGLAQQTPNSGPKRQEMLQTAAGLALNGNEFNANDTGDVGELQRMKMKINHLEAVLKDVTQYQHNVSAPSRAVQAPKAVSMATFTQGRLSVRTALSGHDSSVQVIFRQACLELTRMQFFVFQKRFPTLTLMTTSSNSHRAALHLQQFFPKWRHGCLAKRLR